MVVGVRHGCWGQHDRKVRHGYRVHTCNVAWQYRVAVQYGMALEWHNFEVKHGCAVPHTSGVLHGCGVNHAFQVPHGCGVWHGAVWHDFKVRYGYAVRHGYGVPACLWSAAQIWSESAATWLWGAAAWLCNAARL